MTVIFTVTFNKDAAILHIWEALARQYLKFQFEKWLKPQINYQNSYQLLFY